MFYNAGIIFEGGGMRGAYTAGIIDALLEHDMNFEYCYGISSGATHATTYLSRQRGRAIQIVTDYIKDKRYFSIKNLIKTGNLFNVDFIYDTIPHELNPYDYETAKNNPAKFFVGVINMETSKGEFLRVKDIEEEYMKVCASMSLPLIANMVEIDGQRYLDGGIADSLPIQRSINDGNKKSVLVLTQDATYRKKLDKILPLVAIKYRKFPGFVHMVKTRHIRYNASLDQIAEEEKAGRAFVLRPKKPVKIGRLELNRKKMLALYREGYEDGIEAMPRLKAFLEDTC
ncbi:MAG TPA: patatin family protein [Methanocorpusculum sp.]|nr:patatin family protein [Methanocorpusculum sp.]HJJ69720.1 patatin family protein [Methanocorpusculum sp.]HJJ75705.1 patatin family protein [Methanocorpusculum sp.]HJJ78522.1 patatin family protein [Methanocorpusculum sp.]HJJ83516.1 patatin family protein [Methanocorpusculum sp.]